MSNNNIKEVVKQKYAEIVVNAGEGCGSGGCCGADDYSTFNDDYSKLEGYVADADLSLGCGMPTEHAGIKPGDTVLDLGSGAGNDVFVARQLTGEKGKVIGLDMTPEMIAKANQNKEKLGYSNVEFVHGEIEDMPLEENSVDVIVSNCVLNLVPDKEKAFKEMYRVTKPGGHFCVSDIVTLGEMPEELLKEAEFYTGCISGALDQNDYISLIEEAGFTNVEIKTEKVTPIPEDLLDKYLSPETKTKFLKGETTFKSITVVGYK